MMAENQEAHQLVDVDVIRAKTPSDLSEAQIELLVSLVDGRWLDDQDQAVINELVVQRLSHLIARAEEHEAQLQRLAALVAQLKPSYPHVGLTNLSESNPLASG